MLSNLRDYMSIIYFTGFKMNSSVIVLGILLTIIVIAFIIYVIYRLYNSKNDSDNSSGKKTGSIDYSDIPIPPNTFDNCRTYEAPRRNVDLTLGTKNANYGIDDTGKTYSYIPEDSDYSIM